MSLIVMSRIYKTKHATELNLARIPCRSARPHADWDFILSGFHTFVPVILQVWHCYTTGNGSLATNSSYGFIGRVLWRYLYSLTLTEAIVDIYVGQTKIF